MADANVISLPPAPLPPAALPRINAHAPLWRIVDALAASGWGDLRHEPQGVRSYLLAIAQLADQKSGIAEVTDAQAAERAGISRRSVMRARQWLQTQGLVVMIRRGARQGLRGVPSVLSVTKTALVALLPGARTAKDARARRRAEQSGGARRLVPNVTAWRPFPSSGRKTAATAPRRGRPGLSAGKTNSNSATTTRPQVATRPVQDELRALDAHATQNPVTASTLAAVRALAASARAEARARVQAGLRTA